jgi:hypothetical protein
MYCIMNGFLLCSERNQRILLDEANQICPREISNPRSFLPSFLAVLSSWDPSSMGSESRE